MDNQGAVDRGTFSSQLSSWQLAPTFCWYSSGYFLGTRIQERVHECKGAPPNQTASKLLSMHQCASPSEHLITCRLKYGMDMMCIVCELGVVVCTLVHLFNLRATIHSGREGLTEHRSREIALGFLSLGFTSAVLVVMAIGTERILRTGRTVWARVSGHLGATLPHDRSTRVHSEVNASVADVLVDIQDTEHEGRAMADDVGPSASQVV